MLQIQLNGFAEVAQTVSNIEKQVAFATSNALNKVAVSVQRQEIEKEIPGHLTIRSRWFQPGTRFGVNIRFANKTRLEATVGTQAPWLKLQEEGGTKKPPKRALAIASSSFFDIKALRKRSEKPSRIKSRKGVFMILSGPAPGMYLRFGAGKREIKLIYLFANSAKVPRRLHFYDSGAVVVQQTFPAVFSQEFAKAILTAK